MVYKNNRKGAQGIGTLIIFIALILVAAVAAGVLISTAGKLQGKAETTGDEIQQRLATGFTVIQVGVNGTDDSTINQTADVFDIRLRLSPGSDAIRLSDITLALVTQRGSFSYMYNGSSGPGLISVSDISGSTTDGYINDADVVTLSIPSADSAGIGENEDFEVTIFPGAGNAQRIALVTPPSLVNFYTVLK